MKTKTAFSAIQTLTLGMTLGVTGCVLVDTGEKLDPSLNGIHAISEGTGPRGCPVIEPQLTAEPNKYLKASYQESACAKLRLCVDPSAWAGLSPGKYIPGIDMVILFDVTGSMTPYIQSMIRNMQQLITNLSGMTSDLRMGLASYKDFPVMGGQPGDFPYRLEVPLTSNLSDVSHALGNLRASGGGDLPESMATAIRAAVDGKGMDGFFAGSDMNWSTDASRVKIVLGISDAVNKRQDIPAGAATLEEAAALLKEKGILFLGMGRMNGSTKPCDSLSTCAEPDPSGTHAVYTDYTSYQSFAYVADFTGAVVRAPGLDLDGDGHTSTFGEINAGDPAVLLMTNTGSIQGAPASADQSKVVADAIAKLVEQTRPFNFNLTIQAGGHVYTPTSNQLAVSPEISEQRCFSLVVVQPVVPVGCPGRAEVLAYVTETGSGTWVDPSNLSAAFQVNLSCDDRDLNPSPSPIPVGPSPTPSATPTPTAEPSPSPTPVGPPVV